MSTTEDAEREASEVLHSLLSVERIDRKSPLLPWQPPTQEPPSISINNIDENSSSSGTVDVEITDPTDELDAFVMLTKCPTPNPTRPRTKTPRKRSTKKTGDNTSIDSSDTIDTLTNVQQRLWRGCECQGDCFGDQYAENVLRHRANVTSLSRDEHDMYLMGMTMACLANRKETGRHKERIRQRATYVYQGRRVCLDAFLYLENVTQYHLKRIRSHVMANGVRPRVHGNHGKKPHNTLPSGMDEKAVSFVNDVLARQSSAFGQTVIFNESRASIYQQFKVHTMHDGRSMGYSSFRNFLKRKFPHVRFMPKATDAK